MKLLLKQAIYGDLEDAKSIFGPSSGDLVAAACSMVWPVDAADLESFQRRAEWSCQQQQELWQNDATARFVKIVDGDKNDELVALARWHCYSHGYEHVDDLETVGQKMRDDASTWPEGLNKDLYLQLLDPLFARRRTWMGEGKYWVLTNVVTREPLRQNGAGSMLLEWGLKQAKEDGVPAYLEAVPTAKTLYEKHGFKVVGTAVIEVGGMDVELCDMRADP